MENSKCGLGCGRIRGTSFIWLGSAVDEQPASISFIIDHESTWGYLEQPVPVERYHDSYEYFSDDEELDQMWVKHIKPLVDMINQSPIICSNLRNTSLLLASLLSFFCFKYRNGVIKVGDVTSSIKSV